MHIIAITGHDSVFVNAGLEELEEVGTGRGGSESEESDPAPSERGSSPAGELDDQRAQNAELTAPSKFPRGRCE